MTLLETITSPEDVKALQSEQLPRLAEEIRQFLVEAVSRTGGHLGPNLGVVELTIAVHRVFDSPRDVLVWDTGHIAYVHKLLTGRQDFSGLRQRGGISGYPSRGESEHDVMENSHATTSLSWAEGIAKGLRLQGVTDRHVVAVIGDGALTGGMAWEAINNIAADEDLPLIVVVNDNGRSYARTIGGLAQRLGALRTLPQYEDFLDWSKDRLQRAPLVGKPAYGVVHGMKKGLKDMVAPQGLFEDLGMKYVGPVDGHDEQAVEAALRRARRFGGPVIVHVLTKKGRGYDHARAHQDDHFHGIGVINPETGLPLETPGRSWTDVFSDEMVALGEERSDLVAITAAMLIPVGLRDFQLKFPDRVFDVGIAEQHAVTMAAGLSYSGLHPVVCAYSTFLNRAFDQVLFDAAMHRQGITFVLDRAGVTGSDGPSHNGMWDMAVFAAVPGLRLIAPRDGGEVARALREAVEVDDAPTVVRFPKATVGEAVPAVRVSGTAEIVAEPDTGDVDVLIVALGPMVATCLTVSDGLTREGRRVRVVDPRWALPVSEDVVDLARHASLVVTVEDGLVAGGVGSRVAQAMAVAGVHTPVRQLGIPQRFLAQGSRGQVLAECGLDAAGVSLAVREALGH